MSKLKPTHRHIKRLVNPKSYSTKQKLFIFVVGFAIVGTVTVLLTHAATFVANLEPEQGTLSGNALKVTGDSSASNNSYVQFKASLAGAINDGRDIASFTGTGINIGITPHIGPAASGIPTFTRNSSGVASCAAGLTAYSGSNTIPAGTYDKYCFRGGGFVIKAGVTITNSTFLVDCGDTGQAGLQMDGTGTGSPASLYNIEETSLTIPNDGVTDPSCDRAIGVTNDGGWTLDHVWAHDMVRGMSFSSHGTDPSNWSSSTSYSKNSFVMYNDGSSLTATNDPTLAYISLTDNNTGNMPTKSGPNWRVATADDFLTYQPSRMRVLKDSLIGNTKDYSASGNHTSVLGHGNGAHSYYVAIENSAFVNMSQGDSSGMIQIYPELGVGDGPDGSGAFWLMEGNYYTGTNGLVCTQFGGSGSEIDHHDMIIRNNFYGVLWNGSSCTDGTPNSDSDNTMGSRAGTLRNTWTNNVWYAPGQSKNGTAIGG